MKKEIKDYLHLYLGCEVMGEYNDSPRKGYLTGIGNGGHEVEIQFFEDDGFNVFEEPEYNDYAQVKPLLSPLSERTDKENHEIADELGIITSNVHLWIDSALRGNLLHFDTQVRFINELRKRNFDCDGLIEAGLAIDKTKL